MIPNEAVSLPAEPGPGMRGRTRPGRLKLVDRFLTRTLPRTTGVVVDLGIGETPDTALELQAVLPCPLIAVEREPSWVQRAKDAGLDARVGDHHLPLLPGESPIAIRAINVFRGYREADALAALEHLARYGALLLEGSTDLEGHLACAWVIAKGQPRQLLFATDFERGFGPWMFRDVLPRALRRSVHPGTWIHGFLTRWEAATTTHDAQGWLEAAQKLGLRCDHPGELLVTPGAPEALPSI